MQELDAIAEYYIPENDFDKFLINYGLTTAQKYFGKGCFLELGCATGESTLRLLHHVDNLDVVEGAQSNIEKTRAKIEALIKDKQWEKNKNIVFFNSLWEDFFWPEQKYSDIIWFHGLEHINSPDKILSRARRSLLPGGRLHVITPNANSYHRKLGVNLGMLKDIHELNERDKKVGHVAVYDRQQVFDLLQKNGFLVKDWHGVFFKLFSNKIMFELCQKEKGLAGALFALGKDFPENCAELYICAVPGGL